MTTIRSTIVVGLIMGLVEITITIRLANRMELVRTIVAIRLDTIIELLVK